MRSIVIAVVVMVAMMIAVVPAVSAVVPAMVELGAEGAVVRAIGGMVLVVAAVVTLAGVMPVTKVSYTDNTSIMLRLSFIQAFKDNLADLIIAVGDKKWDCLVKILIKNLDGVVKELTLHDGLEENGLHRVLKAIDLYIVCFLGRGDVAVHLPFIFKSYFPKAGQSWTEVFQKLSDLERKFLEREDRHALKIDLNKRLLDYIQKLKFDILSIGDRSDEGKFKEEHVCRVFFATDRQESPDTQFTDVISTREPRLLYGWFNIKTSISMYSGLPIKQKLCSIHTSYQAKTRKFLGGGSLNMRWNDTLQLRAADEGSELLLFVHGSNTTLLQAVKQAALLKVFMEFQGTCLLYSWTAKHNLRGYCEDEANVEKTLSSFKECLDLVTKKVPRQRTHLIAYNMGCRVLSRALSNLGKQLEGDLFVTFLAPDGVSHDFYETLPDAGEGVTEFQVFEDRAPPCFRNFSPETIKDVAAWMTF